MRIFHIASVADWTAARKSGTYTTSTKGRTLAEEGYIHASRREQVQEVFAKYYRGGREPLVLLSIDTDKLDAEVREEQVGDETFPHIYGPITPGAVVNVQPLSRTGGTASLLTIMLGEVFVRIFLAFGALLLSVIGVGIGKQTSSDWGPFLGGVIGLAVGIVLMALVLRRRR